MRLPLLQQAGVQMLRYPGGSYGDIYNWQDNTAPGGYVARAPPSTRSWARC